jgi:hypothetical protein
MVGGHDLAAPRDPLCESGAARLGAVSESPVGSNATVAPTHHQSDCPACTAAAEAPHWLFHADCRGCCARSIARSPQAYEARKAGKQTRGYAELLRQIGGLHKPAITHAEARAAFEADAVNRHPQGETT